VKWCDERAATPRSADIGVTVLRELLKFGRLRRRVRINLAEGIPHLYKAPIELKKPHRYDGLRRAALTGTRRADLGLAAAL
jgi:hypothetical protein